MGWRQRDGAGSARLASRLGPAPRPITPALHAPVSRMGAILEHIPWGGFHPPHSNNLYNLLLSFINELLLKHKSILDTPKSQCNTKVH